MSEHRYGVHDCPNGFYYLRDVTDHSVYIHRNYGYLYSPYKEDIELVSTLLNGLADKVDEQQSTINKLKEELKLEQDFASRWQKESEMLAKENEQLREELNDCEKFRHSVFKRIEKTIEDMDNCVFNKDAKYPCNAYDECLKRKGTNEPSPCMVNWVMGRPFENMIRKEGDDE